MRRLFFPILLALALLAPGTAWATDKDHHDGSRGQDVGHHDRDGDHVGRGSHGGKHGRGGRGRNGKDHDGKRDHHDRDHGKHGKGKHGDRDRGHKNKNPDNDNGNRDPAPSREAPERDRNEEQGEYGHMQPETYCRHDGARAEALAAFSRCKTIQPQLMVPPPGARQLSDEIPPAEQRAEEPTPLGGEKAGGTQVVLPPEAAAKGRESLEEAKK